MDSNNWRQDQDDAQSHHHQQQQQQQHSIDMNRDGGADRRLKILPEVRQKMFNKIIETVLYNLPVYDPKDLLWPERLAENFEQKTYTEATSQVDYVRRIAIKMVDVGNMSPNMITTADSLPFDSVGNRSIPQNPVSQALRSEVHIFWQSLLIIFAPNQTQDLQQILSLNDQDLQQILSQNNLVSAGIQSRMPSVTNLNPTEMPNAVRQSPNIYNMMPSTVYANAQRQMLDGSQVTLQQQQQHSQNPTYLYEQQQQPRGLLYHSHPEQNLIQPIRLHSSQQSFMQTSSALQPSGMQPLPLFALQQNQLSAHTHRLQQSQQVSLLDLEQTAMMRQQMLSSQQQLTGQQQDATNLQQDQLLGQQTIMQQNQRLLRQSNYFPNLQQQHQIMAQQTIQSNIHQAQLGSQSYPTGSQQQQLLLNQSDNSGMQNNQHNLLMLQQSKVPILQTQQNASNLEKMLGQQPQQPQQQLMSHMQLSMQQHQQNPLHRVIQQNQLAGTWNANGGDWQEEVYQRIRTMKDLHFPELMEMYHKITAKLQQHDSLQRQLNTEQLETLKFLKTGLERILTDLQVSKNDITTTHKDKLGEIQKQIIFFHNINRPRKPDPSTQQGQFPLSRMQSTPQSLQAQSQNAQLETHENQVYPQLQAMNFQGSEATMQQSNITITDHGSKCTAKYDDLPSI